MGMIVIDSRLSSKTITSNINVTNDLKKYFKYFNFFSRYDEGIQNNDSILNIVLKFTFDLNSSSSKWGIS